jgi:hypothetical protein
MEDLQGQMRRGVDVVNEFTERKDGMIVLGEADLQYIQEVRAPLAPAFFASSRIQQLGACYQAVAPVHKYVADSDLYRSSLVSDVLRLSTLRGLEVLVHIFKNKPCLTPPWPFACLLFVRLDVMQARTAGLRKCQRASCSEIEDESVQKFSCCSACSSPYCSRECQKADWKPCHKAMCEQLKSLRAGEPLDRHEVR